MMPAYFPDGTHYTSTNTWRYDTEQANHKRHLSEGSRPYTANSYRKPGHSRSDSAASQTYIHSYSNGSRILSRPGSTGLIYTPTAPLRSQSNSANHSRAGSRTGHSRTLSNTSPFDTHAVTELQTLPARQPLDLGNNRQNAINPLRISPVSPVIPQLPRLPENMAVLGPLDYRTRTAGVGIQERPIRMPLFHKPLPITPLPGHKNAPQYLTAAQDQAILPMMLSPGLVPQPLTLGTRSPRNFAF